MAQYGDEVFLRLGAAVDEPLTRRNLLRVAGAGMSAATLLAACGGSDSGSTTTGKTGAAAAVKKGGTLNLAMSDVTETEGLDPALSFTTNDAVYCGLIYESLASTDQQWNLKPVLATEWTATEDAKEWTFKLRQGVTWHDGTPFTAKDVVWTVGRWLDKELGAPIYARLEPSLDPEGVTALDDHTVVFKLKRSDALLPVAFTTRNTKIVKDGTKEFTVETAIGTGPFKIKSWSAGRSWSVVKNPTYWQKGLPYLDGVNTVIVPDQGTKLQSVLSGPSHLGDAVEISSFATVDGNANAELSRIANRQAWVFILDQSKKPFNDKRLVAAIKAAMDRQKLLDSVLQGNGSVAADIPVPKESQFFPPGLDPQLDYENAKSLLAEAGYPDGFDMELNTSAVAAGMVENAQAFQQVMKPAGINVKLKQHSPTAYWNKGWMQTSAFQDYWNPRHPADMLSLFYRTGATWNEPRYSDPKLDSLIDGVFEQVDTGAQRKAIQDAFAYAVENVGYSIPTWSESGWVNKKSLKGLELNYTDYVSLTKAWLDA